jgi:hypothetical protein
MTMRETFEKANKTEFHSWPVVDERGVVGILSYQRDKERKYVLRGE